MTELLTGLFATYGLGGMAITIAAAQFGVPLPTSILLMTVGALSAAAEFSPTQAFLWGLGGAVAGDQAGYFVGRFLANPVDRLAARSKPISAGLAAAREFSSKWGRASVFLSRWLVSPVGPWLNLTSGATHLAWPTFTVWGVSGEVIWVAKYMALGYAFSAYISGIADILANAGWALAAIAATGFLGWQLWKRLPARA